MTVLEVGGRRVEVTNLDEVLYPATGFTKGDVVRYYQAVAPALLPHVVRRPLTLKRYPGGVRAAHVYEKRCPPDRPGWIEPIEMPSERHGTIAYCAIDDVAGLVWLADLASIEIHPFLARAPRLDRPTQVVFDLDPGEGRTALDAARVATTLHDALGDVGFDTLVKSTGSEGLHVTLPLDGSATYDQAKGFARTVARFFEQHWPELVVAGNAKAERRGKVLVDWSQNDLRKSNIAPYSLRGKRDEPTVAAPLTWPEVDEAIAAGDPSALLFGPDETLERLGRLGELHAAALRTTQTLGGSPPP